MSTSVLMGGRVRLTPRPVRRQTPALEAAMLGHLPGRVRLDRLGPQAREAMRRAGFGEAVEHLDDLPRPRLPASELERVRDLAHLPVPLLSAAELDDIFPDARTQGCDYESLLAGRGAWLPQAVDDYFANGGERLWIVRIPQGEGRNGFLPRSLGAPAANVLTLEDTLDLRGLAPLLIIPELAVIAAPDLERLLVPARLPDYPPVVLANPVPAFNPCERRQDTPPPQPGPVAVPPTGDSALTLIDRIQIVLGRHRPDVQYLHSLPLVYWTATGGPAPDPEMLAGLAARQGTPEGAGLRRVQFLYPYLRGPRLPLASAVGLVAGRQAWVARRAGVWRSMAGQALVTDAIPYPQTDKHLAERLHQAPGVGVLMQRRGRVELMDERLVVPALHPDDYLGAQDVERFDGFRSAEVSRFLGFLVRRLRALGELLIFDLDRRDPRPRLLLEDLFRALHGAGALRGALPEEAFSIRERLGVDGAMAYDIELAPAFPVDRLRLTFSNREGEWQAGSPDLGTGVGVQGG